MLDIDRFSSWDFFKIYFDNPGICWSGRNNKDEWSERWALSLHKGTSTWVIIDINRDEKVFNLDLYPSPDSEIENIHMDLFDSLDTLMYYIISKIKAHFDNKEYYNTEDETLLKHFRIINRTNLLKTIKDGK